MRARDKHRFSYDDAVNRLRSRTWEMAEALANAFLDETNSGSELGGRLWTVKLARIAGARDALKGIIWREDWPT